MLIAEKRSAKSEGFIEFGAFFKLRYLSVGSSILFFCYKLLQVKKKENKREFQRLKEVEKKDAFSSSSFIVHFFFCLLFSPLLLR